MIISSIQEIIAEMRAGKMVILVDEENRENEGDLVLAADFVTPEAINFMATHGRGLICMTLTEERCRQLNLPLMVIRQPFALGHQFHRLHRGGQRRHDRYFSPGSRPHRSGRREQPRQAGRHHSAWAHFPPHGPNRRRAGSRRVIPRRVAIWQTSPDLPLQQSFAKY